MVGETVLEALAGRHRLALEELSPTYLEKNSDGTFTLTEDGREVAETWRRIVDPDPRERLDIDFWPEPQEERRLGATWDWQDDPPA